MFKSSLQKYTLIIIYTFATAEKQPRYNKNASATKKTFVF